MKEEGLGFCLLDGFHIVGWQHASLASALNGSIHPALVNRLNVHNDVAILEGHLIGVSSRIVVQSTNGFLSKNQKHFIIVKQTKFTY